MLNSGKNMDKDFVKEKTCGDDDLIWKECSKKEILSIPVFSVMETTSISPEGETGNYYVMDANDWVITIPVMGKDFLMVKQWRHGEKQISIEFPGGVLEKGEDAEDGAKRELREETGFEAKKMVHLGTFNPNPALMTNHVHIFAALELENCGNQELDKDEYVNVLKMPENEVLAKLGTKEFQHALMGCAMAMYLRYKLKEQQF